MSLNFPKHPKDMNREELFDMMQKVQSVARKNNQHSPMPTRTTLREGQTPTPADLHEEAARKELAGYYEEQVAMAGPIGSANNQVFEDTANKVITDYHKSAAREEGRLGQLSLEQVLEKYGNHPEIRSEYLKGEAESRPGVDPRKRAEDIKKEQGYK